MLGFTNNSSKPSVMSRKWMMGIEPSVLDIQTADLYVPYRLDPCSGELAWMIHSRMLWMPNTRKEARRLTP